MPLCDGNVLTICAYGVVIYNYLQDLDPLMAIHQLTHHHTYSHLPIHRTLHYQQHPAPKMQGSFLSSLALMALQASVSTQLHIPRAPGSASTYPTRTIANVSVVDTEIVREAQAFARNYSSDIVWNHVMRGWRKYHLVFSSSASFQCHVPG